MLQTHRGFQAVLGGISTLQSTLNVLSATTAVIGVGVAANIALSAVSLHQVLQLKRQMKELRRELQEGLLDLKTALKDQGEAIIQHIDYVAQDIKFEQHRVVLIRAYGLFTQALNRLHLAMKIQDEYRRNSEIDAVRGMLFQALSDYTNPALLDQSGAAGYLRRMECAWAIEQTIITTYQLQNELSAANDRLMALTTQVRNDAVKTVKRCQSEAELEFLFPEVVRINTHDVPIIELWQMQTEWMESLSPDDRQLLASSELETVEMPENQGNAQKKEPVEVKLYQDLKSKSHYAALQDQLCFIVRPELRHSHESYISQQAKVMNRPGLAPSRWEDVPDFAVANLYWYFKAQE
ncbi:hypothetical protein PN462_23220 [Spirulina sp. CS-785/01]|uniref:hypothetical protein n=1 Tax=Spirulina sp. CS-785/01 TaxID=3021716 RepID=UPI00232FAB8C|nr:hypothetical protein [Spirulina sp. CS-785/01]MDB9316041.1 hypothetical protein [Spirulina sp. CS-785/01]